MWAVITTQSILAVSLVVVIVLLLLQSRRLRRREAELQVVSEALLDREQLATLGRMMAGIAHELNTPLGAVRCSVGTRQKAVAMIDEAVSSLAGQSSVPADEVAEFLTRVNRALRALHGTDPVLHEALTRSDQLIRELRLAGRGQEDEPQPIDVNALVEGTLLLAQHELRDSVTVNLELGDLQPVPGWPGPLGQVLLNLVLNARQAAGEQATITIATEMSGSEVVVRVSDDGPGLPAGASERLFKPGFTTKSSHEGTGLGLFISRRILQRHQGRISAVNRPAGGAEFTVVLPTVRSDAGCVDC